MARYFQLLCLFALQVASVSASAELSSNPESSERGHIVRQPSLPSRIDRTTANSAENEQRREHSNRESLDSSRNEFGTLTFAFGGYMGAAYSSVNVVESLELGDQSLSSGSGIEIGVRGTVNFAELPIEVIGGVGYKLDVDDRGGNESKFERYPFALGLFWGNKSSRVGAGLVSHISSSLLIRDDTGSRVYSASPNVGYFFRLDIVASNRNRWYYGINYESIEYEFDQLSKKIDGKNWGVHLGWGY